MATRQSTKRRVSGDRSAYSKLKQRSNETVVNSHLFDSWTLIQRDPHPQSRDTKAQATNQTEALKFG